MKTLNNKQFLLLLLFTSLLPCVQIFAQNKSQQNVAFDSSIVVSGNVNSTDKTDSPLILDGIEIKLLRTDKGLRSMTTEEAIIKNTFSKLGNTFYDLFTNFNQSEGVTYPFVITVEEKQLKTGPSSEIRILVKNRLVYKFRAFGKEKYLLAAAQETNKRLRKYFADQRLYAVE